MPDKEAIARLLAKAGSRSRSRIDVAEAVAIVTRVKASGRLRAVRATDLASARERRMTMVERVRRIDQVRKPPTGD